MQIFGLPETYKSWKLKSSVVISRSEFLRAVARYASRQVGPDVSGDELWSQLLTRRKCRIRRNDARQLRLRSLSSFLCCAKEGVWKEWGGLLLFRRPAAGISYYAVFTHRTLDDQSDESDATGSSVLECIEGLGFLKISDPESTRKDIVISSPAASLLFSISHSFFKMKYSSAGPSKI